MLNKRAFHAAPATNRNSQRLLLLLMLLLIALGSGCCNADGAFSFAHVLGEGKHKLCGQSLNDAMERVCVNGYNTIPKKRADSGDAAALELALDSVPHGAGYARSPLLSGFCGTEVLIKTRRLKRQGSGIHEECCLNSCTYTELLAYCR